MGNLYVETKTTERTTWIEFKNKNQREETVTIILSKCDDIDSKNSLPKLWFKKGHTNKILETYWIIETYVRDSEGNERGAYNPQIKMSNDGKGSVINFDWILEATEENKEKIINEIYRLFSTAEGKTATEVKVEKVREYAKENNIQVVEKIPEGWVKMEYATDPIGSVSIVNMKPSLKALKSGLFKRMLLLI